MLLKVAPCLAGCDQPWQCPLCVCVTVWDMCSASLLVPVNGSAVAASFSLGRQLESLGDRSGLEHMGKKESLTGAA